jgi:hypothetical protein
MNWRTAVAVFVATLSFVGLACGTNPSRSRSTPPNSDTKIEPVRRPIVVSSGGTTSTCFQVTGAGLPPACGPTPSWPQNPALLVALIHEGTQPTISIVFPSGAASLTARAGNTTQRLADEPVDGSDVVRSSSFTVSPVNGNEPVTIGIKGSGGQTTCTVLEAGPNVFSCS